MAGQEPKRGRFITFEGIDGCGKSTQIQILASALAAEGHEVICLREPGGTELSEEIRHLLLNEDSHAIADRAELLLFLAARSQLVSERILPALEAGQIVLSDRFYDSTMAYQGYGRGLDLDYLRDLNDFACHGLKPDLTLLLEVSELALKRRIERREAEERNRFDNAQAAFLERVRKGFMALASAEPRRIQIVSTEGSKSATAAQIYELVRDSLKTDS